MKLREIQSAGRGDDLQYQSRKVIRKGLPEKVKYAQSAQKVRGQAM